MSLPKENLDLQNYLVEVISEELDQLCVSDLYSMGDEGRKIAQVKLKQAWEKLDNLGWDFEVMLKRKMINGSESQ